MRFLCGLQQGHLPATDLNDIDPSLLTRYYGTVGRRRHSQPGQTGAGHYDMAEPSSNSNASTPLDSGSSSDSSDSMNQEGGLARHVAADQQRHVRHPPINVPDGSSPFSAENEELFFKALHEIRRLEIVPLHFGVSSAEWVDGSYGDIETITFGRGGRQEDLELPFTTWWPRAVAWAQGLELMTAILVEQEE